MPPAPKNLLHSRKDQRLAWILARALSGQALNGEIERLEPSHQDAVKSILSVGIDHRRKRFDGWLAGLDADEANSIRQAVLASDPRGPDPDRVATLADIADELAKIEWEWDGWLPRGFVTLLVAEQGVGKSFLALWGISRSILTGASWPDGTWPITDDKSLVLWCEAESAHQLLLERAERAGLPKNRILFPTSDAFATIKLDNAADVADLRETVRIHRPRLLIYDALSGGHDKRENSSDEMIPVVRALSEIAREFRLAVLLIHHCNKSVEAGEISLRTIRGASGITQLARLVWALEKLDDQDWLRLRTIKCNIAKHPEPVGVRIGDTTLDYGSAPKPRRNGRPIEIAKKFLMDFLSRKPMPADEVYEAADEVGISRSTLERAKTETKVVSVRKGFGPGSKCFWSLPARSSDTIDVQAAEPEA